MSHDNRVYLNTTQNNIVVLDSEHNQITVSHPVTQVIEITQATTPTITVIEETPNNVSVTEALGNTVIVTSPGPQGPVVTESDPVFTAWTSSFNSYTGSVQTQVNSLNSATSSYVLNSVTSSMSVLSSSYAVTASYAINVPTIDTSVLVGTASFNIFTGSIQTQVNNLTSATGSYVLNSVTSSMIVSGALTASYINALTQNVQLTGNLSITGNMNVIGTASYTYVTTSQLDVGTNTISVNIAEPAERFGGLVVYDSGSLSHLATASLLWDSLHNHWVYQNVSGSTYSGGMLLAGPRNTGVLGDEPNLSKWFIPRSDGGDHLNDTQIFSSASTHIITGSLTVTEYITGSLLGTSSWATNAVTASFAPNYVLNSMTSSFIVNNQTGSFAITGSNTFTGNQIISGSFIIETGSINTTLRVTQNGTGTILTIQTGSTDVLTINNNRTSSFTGNVVLNNASTQLRLGIGRFDSSTLTDPLYPIHVISQGGNDATMVFDGKQYLNNAANANIILAADTIDKTPRLTFFDRGTGLTPISYNGTATYTGASAYLYLERSGSGMSAPNAAFSGSLPLITGANRNNFYIVNEYTDRSIVFRLNATVGGQRNVLNILSSGVVNALTSFIAPTLQGSTLYPQSDNTLSIRTRDAGLGNQNIIFGTGNPGGIPFTRLTVSASGAVIIPSGNLGIGTTSPGSNLHVVKGSSGVAVLASDIATFENNTHAYITVLSPNGQNSGLHLGSGPDPLGAYVRWNQDNNLMSIGTANDGDNINFLTGNEVSSMYLRNNVGLGINTTAPLYRLHVRSGSVTNSSTFSGTLAVVENSGSDSYLSILSSTGFESGVGFGSEVHRSSARLAWTHNSLNFSLATNTGSAFLTFGTGQATERMRITTNGLVGIGITAPDSNLHIHKGSAGTVSATSETVLTIENSTTNYLSMLAPDANFSGIVFGSPTDNFGSFIRWGYTSGKLEIGTAESGQYIELKAGNDVPKAYVATTGFGINKLPTAALDVSGSTILSGSLIVSGSSLIVSGTSNFIGEVTVTGAVVPGGPYTNNISSHSLGSPLKAWQDVYVGSGSVYFINAGGQTKISANSDGELSLPATTVTGKLYGNVWSVTPAGKTILDCSLANFFTLTLSASETTEIDLSNFSPGQTVNLKITMGGSNTITFAGKIKQSNESPYIPSSGPNEVDILTFIAFDASTVYVSHINNLL